MSLQPIAKMMDVGKVAQTIKIELKSKPSYAQVYGKLSLNALVDNLDLKMNQAAGDFKMLGTKNNLMLEYKNKEDGKLFSLKVNDKTSQIFENLSKMCMQLPSNSQWLNPSRTPSWA